MAGEAAGDIGMQSGGWTIDWQGVKGHITVGTTILAGITQTVSANTHVEYSPPGEFKKFKDAQGNPEIADVGSPWSAKGRMRKGWATARI